MATGTMDGRDVGEQGYANADLRSRAERPDVDLATLSPAELVEHVQFLNGERERLRLQERKHRERQQEVLAYLKGAVDQVQNIASGENMAADESEGPRVGFY